jgi:hypothetical protein
MKATQGFSVRIWCASICFAVAIALIALGALASAQTASSTTSKYRIEETSLGPWYWDQLFEAPSISLDGKHVAYQVRGHCEPGIKMCIFLDGKSVSVGTDPIIYRVFLGSDGSHLGYVASGEGRRGMVTTVDGQSGPAYFQIDGGFFSPDGKHFAYVAQDKRGSMVVVDGHEGAAYNRVTQVAFSPDDEVYYGAVRGKQSFIVIGQKEIGTDWDMPFTPVFSKDGMHMAYVGCTAKMKACSVVLDGKPSPTYDEIYLNRVFFSEDGSRVWFGARSNGKWAVVLDGKAGSSYDGLFHSSCRSSVNMGSLMLGMLLPTPMAGGVVGGAFSTSCSTLDFTFFSPDGKHTWYPAKKGPEWVAVEDGVEGTPFTNVLLNAYSPDSRHLIYTRQSSRKPDTELIADGNKIAEAQGIGFLKYSPDNSRIAYTTYKGAPNKLIWRMVVDGNPGPEFRMIEFPSFSPDSRHLAYLAQTSPSPMMHTVNATDPGGGWSMVLDQQAGAEYSFVIPGTIRYGSDGALEFLAVRKESHDNGDLFRVRYIPTP